METNGIPLPQPTPLSRPFWEAANEGQLVLQRCNDCAAYRWTPQILCPHCLGENYTWTKASGKGTIHSYTIIHRPPLKAFTPPYAIATVELEEGPLMLTHIVDFAPEATRVGLPVQVRFTRASEDINLYTFAPAN